MSFLPPTGLLADTVAAGPVAGAMGLLVAALLVVAVLLLALAPRCERAAGL